MTSKRKGQCPTNSGLVHTQASRPLIGRQEVCVFVPPSDGVLRSHEGRPRIVKSLQSVQVPPSMMNFFGDWTPFVHVAPFQHYVVIVLIQSCFDNRYYLTVYIPTLCPTKYHVLNGFLNRDELQPRIEIEKSLLSV